MLVFQVFFVLYISNWSRKTWERYLEAELGLREYWYPAFFSTELADGQTRSEIVCGERIYFKRVNGTVYGVEDRCPHRGVNFSARPECSMRT